MELPAFAVLSCVLVTPGCGGGTPADAGPPPDCAPGVDLEVEGPAGYQRIAAASEADLILGFQGFKYVRARGRSGALPGSPAGAVIVKLDDKGVRSQPYGDLGFHADGDAGFLTEALRVFFNDDPLPGLVDHGVTLRLHLDCGDSPGGRVILRYDPNCVEGPDGQRICVDAGAPQSVDAGASGGGP